MKKTKIAGISAIAVLATAVAALFLQPTPKPLDQETAKVEETAAVPNQVVHITGTTNVGIENMVFFDDATNSHPSPVIVMNAVYNNQGTSGVSLLHARLDFAHNVTVVASATSSDVYGTPVLRPTKFLIIQSQGGMIISETEVAAASNGSANFILYPGTYEIIPIYTGNIFKQKVLPNQNWGYTPTTVAGG